MQTSQDPLLEYQAQIVMTSIVRDGGDVDEGHSNGLTFPGDEDSLLSRVSDGHDFSEWQEGEPFFFCCSVLVFLISRRY